MVFNRIEGLLTRCEFTAPMVTRTTLDTLEIEGPAALVSIEIATCNAATIRGTTSRMPSATRWRSG